MPSAPQPLGDTQRHVQPVGPRDDEDVVAVAGDSPAADRHVRRGPAARADIRRQPPPSPAACRSRVWYRAIGSRNTRHRAVGLGGRRARPQHRRGIGAGRRRGDDDAGDVAQAAEGVVVVEVPAEALLVAVAGDAHDHRVDVLAGGEERQRRRLAAELVDGVVHVGEVLDLGDRQHARHTRAEGEAEDRLLVEQRVEHAVAAGRPLQPAGDAVDAALGADVLAEHEHRRVGGEQLAERPVDRLGERQRRPVLGERAEERACAGSAGRPRRRVRRPGEGGVGRAARSPRRRAQPPARHQLARPATARRHATSTMPRDELRRRRQTRRRRAARAVATIGSASRSARIAGGVAVRRLDVGAGVTAEAHASQVQDRRPPLARARASASSSVASYTPSGSVPSTRRYGMPGRLDSDGGDPAGRARHADAQPVVLAHEEQRQRHVTVGRCAPRR